MEELKNCQDICNLKLLNLKTYFRYNTSNLTIPTRVYFGFHIGMIQIKVPIGGRQVLRV
jgi:hypothetical protein